MVSLVILGISFITLFQLFSVSLRSVKKSEDYSRALIYARSLMDEAYATSKLTEGTESFTFENSFKAVRIVSLNPSEDKTRVYNITVSISWPPASKLELKGLKTAYEAE